MNTRQLELAGESFDIEDARKVIAGYCFGESRSERRPPQDETYGLNPADSSRRLWGYLSYDCQRGSDPPPNIVDVIAPVLLNVTRGYGVRLVSDLIAIAPMVREEVAAIDGDFCFWHLEPEDVAPLAKPKPGSPSWSLHRAWYLVESVLGVDVAITHKLLHHAWPNLFPLIDHRTIGKLGDGRAWVTILEDLKRQEAEFDDLERWFESLLREREGLPLTRLRLHDILIWCRSSPGEEGKARTAGSGVLTY